MPSPAAEHLGPPPSPRSEAQRSAYAVDKMLETHATACNHNAVKTGDPRWNKAALALLGARRFFRELMHDDDRRAAPLDRGQT